ncbi:MAG: hypothetical protein LBV73_17180 [Paraburkholderia sp.]|jgi:hypothetical protein|nr:hypothetical protein [Paraburkholderia sp.]
MDEDGKKDHEAPAGAGNGKRLPNLRHSDANENDSCLRIIGNSIAPGKGKTHHGKDAESLSRPSTHLDASAYEAGKARAHRRARGIGRVLRGVRKAGFCGRFLIKNLHTKDPAAVGEIDAATHWAS